MDEEVLVTKTRVSTIDITPDWKRLLRWWAENTAQHGFKQDSYRSVAQLMRMSVAVYLEDRDEFIRIVEQLEARS